MCDAAVDFEGIESRHGIGFESYFAEALGRIAPLVADGLVTRNERQLRATDRGRFLLRIVAMCFDRYLGAAEAPAVGNQDVLSEAGGSSQIAHFSRVV